jgi:hypothetical protein
MASLYYSEYEPDQLGVIYCTKFHKDGEHDQSCMPPANPNNPELRLMRAIWGLCPYCDNTEEHNHERKH